MACPAAAALGTQRALERADDMVPAGNSEISNLFRPARQQARKFFAALLVAQRLSCAGCRQAARCAGEACVRMGCGDVSGFFHDPQTVRVAIAGGDNFFRVRRWSVPAQ